MCGIGGFTGVNDPEALLAMSERLRHRGPDAHGEYHSSGISLCHRRLSIIDLSQGAQPMQSSNGRLCVVFNGEIYNHIELRHKLENLGHKFVTDHSDTEVLLHGYREWGEDLPRRLEGMWAFCIHDREEATLFLSRDRFGKKPLFYTLQHGCFAFASELSALQKLPQLQFSLDPLSLKKYFAYAFIPAPRTIFREASKLPSAHNLLYNITTREYKVSRYWRYTFEPFEKIPRKPEEEWGEQLRELLSRAVKKRLMSDVPLGVLLSGGIDSSAVAAMASRHSSRPKTFSIGFAEDSYDESPYAIKVAQHLNTEHFPAVLHTEQMRELTPEILSFMDEPIADDSLLPTYMVCREARKQVTVALGGDGGDELFCGYEPFKVWQWGYRYHKYLPRPVHAAVSFSLAKLGSSTGYMSSRMKIKRFFNASAYGMPCWIAGLMAPLSPDNIEELLMSPCSLEELYSEAIECWDACTSKEIPDRLSQYYIDLYLPNEILVKGDRASMMNSLELRCPFLDIDVADFARKIPWRWRLSNGGGKYILKKALRGVLPQDILYRKKQGFSPPAAVWFKNGELYPGFIDRAGCNTAVSQRVLAAHKSGSEDHTRFLWAQLALAKFIENNKITK